MDVQPPEQLLVSLEQLLQRVHEQALAETPRARQEVVLASRRQPPSVGRLIDVVMAFLADLTEGLDADGQVAFHRAASLARGAAVVEPGTCPAAPLDPGAARTASDASGASGALRRERRLLKARPTSRYARP